MSLTTYAGRPAVRKTYRAGGAPAVHEQMTALWGSPFGVGRRPPGMPEPLALEPPSQAVVTGLVAGEPLGRRGQVGDAIRSSADVARLLADRHGSGVVVPRRLGAGWGVRGAVVSGGG